MEYFTNNLLRRLEKFYYLLYILAYLFFFYFKLTEIKSTPKNVESGVPQGSCLSPLLYVAYIDDLPSIKDTHTSLFVDDTLFCATKRTRREAVVTVQRQLNAATDWFDTWRFKLNVQKAKAILFSRKRYN